MAVSKISSWLGTHNFTEFIFRTKYDLYADMSNPSATPYIRLNGCRFRSTENDPDQLGIRAPFTVEIKIGDAETGYTFTTGTTQGQEEGYIYDLDHDMIYGSYYYIDLSSNQNITIPGNATPFLISVKVTDRNNVEYTFTEPACGPASVGLTGSTSITTGEVSTYTLASSVQSTEYYDVESIMSYALPSPGNSYVYYSVKGYADEYTPTSRMADPFDEISFLPLKYEASTGTVAPANDPNHMNYIEISCYYNTHDGYFADRYTSDGRPVDSPQILIGYAYLPVTVTAGTDPVNPDFAPELESKYYNGNIEAHTSTFGGPVQGETQYQVVFQFVHDTTTSISSAMKYGSYFKSIRVDDYTSGTLVSNTYSREFNSFRYSTSLSSAGSNKRIVFTFTTTLGNVYTYTETLEVIPYSPPTLTTYRARRCSPTSSTIGADIYTYDGNRYIIDDYGEYCLIEWGISVSPLNNHNIKELRIYEPRYPASGSSNYRTRYITPDTYTSSGFYVVPANGELSYDVEMYLYDSFRSITRTAALNTVLAIMDFLKGGSGLAFGKVAELSDTFDVHRNWTLRMPQTIMIGNYGPSGESVNLSNWMASTASRIQTIVDNRPVMIYGEVPTDNPYVNYGHWFDDLNAVCIPSGYGTVQDNYQYRYFIVRTEGYVRAAMKLIRAVTVSRRYLYVDVDYAQTFASPTWYGSPTFRTTIYVMSTEPTTVDQSTGVPNGTILTSRALYGELGRQGADYDGLQYESIYDDYEHDTKNYIDVSRWMGQNVWIAISVAGGLSSGQGAGIVGRLEIHEMSFRKNVITDNTNY